MLVIVVLYKLNSAKEVLLLFESSLVDIFSKSKLFQISWHLIEFEMHLHGFMSSGDGHKD
jgi:hypothetical protein